MKEIERQCSWLVDVGLLRHPEYFAAEPRRSAAGGTDLAVRRRDCRPLGGLRAGNKKIRLPNMEPNRAEDFRLRRRMSVIETVNYGEPSSSTYPTMARQ